MLIVRHVVLAKKNDCDEFLVIESILTVCACSRHVCLQLTCKATHMRYITAKNQKLTMLCYNHVHNNHQAKTKNGCRHKEF